jgi:predicted metalloprotease
MRWRGVERSRNVDDRRGRGATAAAGIGGLGIIGVLLMLFLGGGEGGFGDIAEQLQGLGGPPPPRASQELSAAEQEAGDFIAAVLGTTETFWGDVFDAAGRAYPEPPLVLFTAATQSACGDARAEVRSSLLPARRHRRHGSRVLRRAPAPVRRE